ncbi:hypothetical protein H6792_01545 [Candidatus Nomurabacteria bacterium]|nr:hypothetical protein [Candidatus Nomurabacteria bacterium]
MQTSIIQIGNSKGIRIPKPLLEQSGLNKDVVIKAEKGRILIERPPFSDKLDISETMFLSQSSLALDWLRPEEDEAWEDLE